MTTGAHTEDLLDGDFGPLRASKTKDGVYLFWMHIDSGDFMTEEEVKALRDWLTEALRTYP